MSTILVFFLFFSAESPDGESVETAEIVRGQLSVLLRDNSRSPEVLSGVQSLFHLGDAKDFDAFDPDGGGAAAGLNFEHIIAGHADSANKFTPRHGKYSLHRLQGGGGGFLVRRKEDSPWAVSSRLRYQVKEPHYIDLDFRCQAHEPSRFGERRYAVFFFADYMNDVADVALNFRGVEGTGRAETWVSANAPDGHPDWVRGGTYRNLRADALGYDADHNFKLNLWSYDYPRFTKPFYYGRAARGMVFIIMFDRAWTEEDEIRFSLFKFKLPRKPRPAWDFQYVIHRVEADKEYGFRARVVWKKFVSPEDCLAEYESWAATKRP